MQKFKKFFKYLELIIKSQLILILLKKKKLYKKKLKITLNYNPLKKHKSQALSLFSFF